MDTASILLKRATSTPLFDAQEKPTKKARLLNKSLADSYFVAAPPPEPIANPPPPDAAWVLQSLVVALKMFPAGMRSAPASFLYNRVEVHI